MKIVKGLQLKKKVPTLHVYVCCIILSLNFNTVRLINTELLPLLLVTINPRCFTSVVNEEHWSGFRFPVCTIRTCGFVLKVSRCWPIVSECKLLCSMT